jgi:hypothetical protein
MKKFALIISMVAVFSLQGFSQAGTYSFGLKLGPTFDWASSASTAARNQKMKTGYTLGIIVDHYYTDHIALSTGINYNFWRGQYSFTDSRMISDFLEEARLNPVNRNVRASYFEVPIKVKVKADVIDDWKAFAEAGVGISLNSMDKTKDEYSFYWVNHTDNSYTDTYFYQYRWLQAALNFGIGTEYQINKKFGVFAQLSFNHALTNTFTRDMERLTGSNLKTNFIGIEVGIIL